MVDFQKLQSYLTEHNKIAEAAKKFIFLVKQEGLTEDQVNYIDMIEQDILSLKSKMIEYHNHISEFFSPEDIFPLEQDLKEPISSILIADSDAVQLIKTKEALVGAGHRVITASSGTLAFSYYREDNFDLIVTDCDLNELDGFLLTKAIRKLESQSSKHTPIIAYTSFGGAGYKEQCLDIGMNDYLKKPLMMSELVERISSHITCRTS